MALPPVCLGKRRHFDVLWLPMALRFQPGMQRLVIHGPVDHPRTIASGSDENRFQQHSKSAALAFELVLTLHRLMVSTGQSKGPWIASATPRYNTSTSTPSSRATDSASQGTPSPINSTGARMYICGTALQDNLSPSETGPTPKSTRQVLMLRTRRTRRRRPRTNSATSSTTPRASPSSWTALG